MSEQAKKKFYFVNGAKVIFFVNAEDGQTSRGRAISLLAMHCLAGHCEAEDFTMLTEAEENTAREIAAAAQREIDATRGAVKRQGLTPRQMQVLRGVQEMLSNKEISWKLQISERTVKFHVSALLMKLGVRGRGELAMATLGKGLEFNSHEGERR